MKLSQTALPKVKDKKVRRALAEELDVIDQMINIYIKKNKPNGPLTTFAALKVIRENTGLTDQEILVDEEAAVTSVHKLTN